MSALLRSVTRGVVFDFSDRIDAYSYPTVAALEHRYGAGLERIIEAVRIHEIIFVVFINHANQHRSPSFAFLEGDGYVRAGLKSAPPIVRTGVRVRVSLMS